MEARIQRILDYVTAQDAYPIDLLRDMVDLDQSISQRDRYIALATKDTRTEDDLVEMGWILRRIKGGVK